MDVSIKQSSQQHEVTRWFDVTGEGVEPIYQDNNHADIRILPTSVTLTWTWHSEDPEDHHFRLRVLGQRVLISGRVQPGRPGQRELRLARADRPEWLRDLINQYDDHGEPVVLACGCPSRIVADEGHQEGCATRD